jgi:hypothetical protein
MGVLLGWATGRSGIDADWRDDSDPAGGVGTVSGDAIRQDRTGTGSLAPAAAASPLTSVNPTSLDELFSRDPEGYSAQDIDAVIAEYRRQFAAYQAKEAADAAKPPRARKVKETLDLADLGLKL